MSGAAKPRISVALCTHNGERYVRQQVQSILAQTLPVDEIVVGDDASGDSTIEIVESVVREAGGREGAPTPILKVRRHAPALGVTANFEDALAHSTGDIVLLCDQDDAWEATKVEVIVDTMSRTGAMLIASDATLIDGDGEPLGETLFTRFGLSSAERVGLDSAEPWKVLLRRNALTGATMAVRRELIERSLPFPASWLHDEWLAVVAAVTGRVTLLDAPLTRYRIHGANVIGVRKRTAAVLTGRLTTDGVERNARLLARAEALASRVPAWGLEEGNEFITLAGRKVAHEQMRSRLRRSRVLRLYPVVSSWCAGNYAAFGLGAQDVLRDLVQPLGRLSATSRPMSAAQGSLPESSPDRGER